MTRAIVWIDEREARIFRFEGDDVAQGRLNTDAPSRVLKHRTGRMEQGDLAADLALLDRVIDALRGVQRWHLAGPDKARDYLLGYLEQYKTRDGHIARLLTRLAGVETIEAPTEAALNDLVFRTARVPERSDS
jgi:hypothetical protein